ncbi:ABC transporter permease [Streptomyces armeniacus]|uniref:ABC transporter permease n=2 Tax=Streptomyces armeniacus TaxID=83291 RepID=A0A345Y1H6_9ACTN|nr:ABC transporter permease [Streptomyces armeniacus]
MEWIKLRSLRSTPWALLFTVAGMITIGVVTMANTEAPGSAAKAAALDPTNNVLAGVALGQLVIGILAVLAVTGEYASGSIRSTLAAIPDRRLVLAAKATVLGATSLVVGEVIAFVTFFAGRAALSEAVTDVVPAPALDQPGVLRAVVLSGIYLALIALIGVGLGALTRHTAGGTAAFAGVTFVLPAVLSGLTGITIAKFFPTMIVANSLAVARPVDDMLSPWTGLAVLCGYTAAVLAAGGWLLARRDA